MLQTVCRMWKLVACVAWLGVVAAASTLTPTYQAHSPHDTHLLTSLGETLERNEHLRGLKDASHRHRRSLYGTGLGISVLAVLSFAAFFKFFLYFVITEYHSEGERSFRDDLLSQSWFLSCLMNDESLYKDTSDGYDILERLYKCFTSSDVKNTVNTESISGLAGWEKGVNPNKSNKFSGGS